MSSFPPRQLEVQYLKDQDTMAGTVHGEREISLEALMAVQPSDGDEGAFRFVLAGPHHLMVRLKVADVLPDESFKDMWISLQLELGSQIKLEKNSVASKWLDLEEMIRAQDADATDAEGEEINEAFLEALEVFKKSANAERTGTPLEIEI